MKWTILGLISVFICMCCGSMLDWDTQGNLIVHSYPVWGDWSAHFTFISSILNRGIDWIAKDNPLFYGVPFQYPFLSQLLTAGFAALTGMDVPHATFTLSMLLLFALPFVLQFFFSSLGLSLRQSLLSTFLFLFMGGFQFLDSSLKSTDPLTNQFDQGSIFTQFVLFEFFPQRAFLFGLVVFLLGLSFLIRAMKKPLSRLKWVTFSAIFALLSWVHLHTWIALGMLMLVASLIRFFRSSAPLQKRFFSSFGFGLMIALFSLPLIYFLLLRSGTDPEAASAFRLHWNRWFPGWAQNSSSGMKVAIEMNPIKFWLYNTGLFIPLTLFGLEKERKKGQGIESPLFILAITGGILFALCMFFNIQPYFYDNLKVFTYAFLMFAPLAAVGLDAFFEKKSLMILGMLILGTQTLTATRDYLFYWKRIHGTSFFTADEFELVQDFKNTRRSSDALVLITPKHNHWVPALTGNPVAMGYPGWLWSWGIKYSQREPLVNQMLLGNPDSFSSALPVEYAVIHEQEQVEKKPVNLEYFKSHFKEILSRGGWHVFDLKNSP